MKEEVAKRLAATMKEEVAKMLAASPRRQLLSIAPTRRRVPAVTST
jgi:hypothetical protein